VKGQRTFTFRLPSRLTSRSSLERRAVPLMTPAWWQRRAVTDNEFGCGDDYHFLAFVFAALFRVYRAADFKVEFGNEFALNAIQKVFLGELPMQICINAENVCLWQTARRPSLLTVHPAALCACASVGKGVRELTSPHSAAP
jgi:hypothetical protein